MNKPQSETVANDTLTAEQVRDYLHDHPDFLVASPELLDVIKVPHVGGGTSLLEHQASVLRDKNRTLKTQLREYRDIAAENEQRLQKLHDLHLDMLHAANVTDLLDNVLRRLREDFQCDQAAVLVFGSTTVQHPDLRQAGSKSELFDDVRKRKESICGRLRAEKLTVLFAAEGDTIKSAALAPLDDQAELGLLALGSHDENKFHPGMGTLFLGLLGQMLGQALLPLMAQE